MKLKKDDLSVEPSVLLRSRNKIPMGGQTETNCEAETEGNAIHRLHVAQEEGRLKCEYFGYY